VIAGNISYHTYLTKRENQMNKLLVATLPLLLFPAIAFAEITPNDVVEKMKIGDVKTAEMLTKQMLKDHPDNAKAHYYMGQILATEGEYKGAYSELKKSASLDKSLSFASSPEEFRTKMDKVEMNLGKVEAPEISNKEESSHWFLKLLLLSGIGGLAYWIWSCRPKDEPEPKAQPKPYTPNPAANHPAYASTAPEASARPTSQQAYRPAGNGYYQPSYAAPAAPHVVNNYNSGGNGGLVEGMILGSMMSNHGRNNTVIDRQTIIERDTTTNNSVQNNSFDAGSSSSSNDNDFDSGSDNSSSFDSGSSSFDSGDSGFDSGSND